MTVTVGISENEKIIGTFETECIPNVGELIFDEIKRKHLVVEKRVFGIYNGRNIQEMDVTFLWRTLKDTRITLRKDGQYWKTIKKGVI